MSDKQAAVVIRECVHVCLLCFTFTSKSKNEMELLVILELFYEADKVLITNSTEAMLSGKYAFLTAYTVDGTLVVLLVHAESSNRHYRSVYAWARSQCVCFGIQN